MPTQVVEIDFSLPNLEDSQASVDAFYGSLQRLEDEAPNLSSLLSTIGPSLDLSGLQSQIDSITSQLSDFESALGLGAESVLTLGSNADDASSGLADMNAAAELNTESLTNLGAQTETTSSQVATLGSASEAGASQTRAHGQAAGEAESEFSGLGEALGEVSNIIPGLNGGISQGTSLLSAFSQQAKEGQDQTALIGAGIAALGVGIAGLSWESFDKGIQSIHLLAEQTDLSDQAIAGFQLTLKEAGLSADTANMALERIQLNSSNLIDSLNKGKAPTGTFATGLQAIGISAQQVYASGGDLNTLLPMIADGMQRTSEAAKANGQAWDATGVSMQIFGGRYGAQLAPILIQGSAALQQNTEYVKQLGLASEEQVTHLEDWEVASSKAGEATLALGAAIGSDLSPAMTAAASVVGNATAAFDQLPGPIRDSVVTLPLLGGAALSAAAGVGKLWDIMTSGASTIANTASTVSGWASSLYTGAAAADAAATSDGALSAAQSSVADSGAAAATAISADGTAAAGATGPVEADAAAHRDLATAEDLVGAGGVTAGAGLTTTSVAAQGLTTGVGASVLGIGGLVAVIGGAIAIEARFKDAIQEAGQQFGQSSTDLNQYVGGYGLLSAAIDAFTPKQKDANDATQEGGARAGAADPQIQGLAKTYGITYDQASQVGPVVKDLADGLKLSGDAANAAGPFLAGYANYLVSVGEDAATADSGVRVLTADLNTMAGVLNEHLSTGATGQSGVDTLSKQIDNETKVLKEKQQADADAAAGDTALSQAEYGLADALRSGDAVAIASAQQQVVLATSHKASGSAAQDAKSGYDAETKSMADNLLGKTALVAAENQLSQAYASGDPQQIEAANRAVSLAQAQDQLAASSGKAASSQQSLADAAEKSTAQITNDFRTLSDQVSKDMTDVSTAFGQAPQRSIADWQAFAAQAQGSMSGLLSAVQGDVATIEGLEQQQTQVMSAEGRKQVDDALTAAQGRLKADQDALNTAVSDNKTAGAAIQQTWSAELSDYTSMRTTETTLDGVANNDRVQGAVKVTEALRQSDTQALASRRSTYADMLTLEAEWQSQLLTDESNGDTAAVQYDKNLLTYLNDEFLTPAKAAYDEYTNWVKQDDQAIQSDWQNALGAWTSLMNDERTLSADASSSIIQDKHNVTQAEVDSDVAQAQAAKTKYDGLVAQETGLEQQIIADYAAGDQAAATSAENQLKYVGALTDQAKADYDSLRSQAQADYQAMEQQAQSASKNIAAAGTAAGQAWVSAADAAAQAWNNFQEGSTITLPGAPSAFGGGSGASGGSGSAAGGSSGASAGSGSSDYDVLYSYIESHIAPESPISPAVSAAIHQVVLADENTPKVYMGGPQSTGFGPNLTDMLGMLSSLIPGSFMNSGGAELFIPGGPNNQGGTVPFPTPGPGSASPSTDQLQQAVQQGVQQAIQNLQQNGGLPVSLSNPNAIGTAISSGQTSSQLALPVSV